VQGFTRLVIIMPNLRNVIRGGFENCFIAHLKPPDFWEKLKRKIDIFPPNPKLDLNHFEHRNISYE